MDRRPAYGGGIFLKTNNSAQVQPKQARIPPGSEYAQPQILWLRAEKEWVTQRSEQRHGSDTGEDLWKIGKLNLVDLAGSENILRSGAAGKNQKEPRGARGQAGIKGGYALRLFYAKWEGIMLDPWDFFFFFSRGSGFESSLPPCIWNL